MVKGRKEGKGRRVVLFASQAACSIFLFHLLYNELFIIPSSHSHHHTNWTEISLSNTSVEIDQKDNHHQSILLSTLVRGEDRTKLDATGFACDNTSLSLLCVASKPVKIDTNTMQVHLPPPHQQAGETTTADTVVRPYAGHQNSENIRKVLITASAPQLLTCDHNHQHPALIFSSSGFTGNIFHEFNEILIPLFITSRLFRSRVHFITVDYKASFVEKYYPIFSRLSDHELINPAVNSSVHCFPGSVIGLKFHKFLGINSSENPKGYYSMPDFKQFLRETYKLKIRSVTNSENPPVLLLISGRRTRKFLNEAEMVKTIEELGFRVIIASSGKEMSKLEKFSRVVNSCSVMVGAHGAGLTNEVFLPNGAVMIQIRPLGLEWVSSNYFGEPAQEMGVKYLEYKIKPEESSLVDVYGRDHPAVVDPLAWQSKQTYEVGRAMYLEGQDMRINVNRFKITLVEALGFIANTF